LLTTEVEESTEEKRKKEKGRAGRSVRPVPVRDGLEERDAVYIAHAGSQGKKRGKRKETLVAHFTPN